MARTMWVRTGLLVAGAVAAVTAIGACSSNSGSSAASDIAHGNAGGKVVNGLEAPAGLPQASDAQTRAGSGAVFGTSDGGTNSASVQPNTATAPTALGPFRIQTVDMTVSIEKAADVAAAANKADAIAAKYGGEVFGDDRTAGTDASAQLTLKVPPDKLSLVLNELSALGVEKSRSQSTKDVTAQVIDVDTRVKNLSDSIKSLQLLFSRATKLGDIITLESELSQRESELESTQAQARALHAQTDTATVTVSLITADHAVAPKHHKTGGFVGGLRDGWHAFVTGAIWIAKAIGAVLPFAVLLIVLGFGLRFAWPRLGISRRVRPEPAPAAE